MTLIFGAGAVLLVTAFVSATNQLHPLSDEFISLINSQQTSWRAGRNFPADTPMAHLEMLLGANKGDIIHSLPTKKHDSDLIASLPENFDPRLKWPQCPTLNEIRDQGCCGSCWAFGAVGAMTDRVCIYSNGTKNFNFSAQDLVTCFTVGTGCSGADPVLAWKYWQEHGIVSGGGYNSSDGCMPYEIPNACINRTEDDTPKCKPKCRAGYDVEYKKDKHYGKTVYKIKNEDDIKAELFKNGPIEAEFVVYGDFFQYNSGVYHHTQGPRMGEHDVKMLGWGVEDGEKYWLLANSWNSHWGDKGYFKIRRGTNECGIEGYLVAGDPQ